MSDDMTDAASECAGPVVLRRVQPVVLTGGRSTRFGRDKLLEPYGEGVLVQRPIESLRAIFGPRVMIVGACDERVAALADGRIADIHPGVGPIGGIASALAAAGDIFVLAGDMPNCGESVIRAIIAQAAASPHADAVLGHDGRAQPCLGVYRASVLAALRAAVVAGDYAMHAAISRLRVEHVSIEPTAATNVNTPPDILSALRHSAVQEARER